MATPFPKSANTNTTTKPAEAVKPVDSQPVAEPVATEPVKLEVQAEPTRAAPSAKTTEKVIISLSVPERLARQVRLLSKLEGVTISAIFLNAVSADIPARLKLALAAMIDE